MGSPTGGPAETGEGLPGVLSHREPTLLVTPKTLLLMRRLLIQWVLDAETGSLLTFIQELPFHSNSNSLPQPAHCFLNTPGHLQPPSLGLLPLPPNVPLHHPQFQAWVSPFPPHPHNFRPGAALPCRSRPVLSPSLTPTGHLLLMGRVHSLLCMHLASWYCIIDPALSRNTPVEALLHWFSVL